MKKRLLKVAITSALTVAFAVPALANPFSDVPSDHWAYKAVNELQQAGIVEGWDGKYQGDNSMTRYEMAQIVAKAMTKAQTAEQQEVVGKLSKEFAVELMNLGVQVGGLEQKVDNMVKVSGDARVRYFHTEDSDFNDDGSITDYRARVSFDGKINDNLKFNARLSSGNADARGTANNIKLDTANVSLKTYAFDTTIGRQDIKLGSGFLMDTQMNGIATQVGDLKLFGGHASQNSNISGSSSEAETVYGAEYSTRLANVDLTANYLKTDENREDIYGAIASAKITNGVSAVGEYFKNDDNGAEAKTYGVKLNKLGLSVNYRDVDNGGLTQFSTLNNNHFFEANGGGFKGMEYQLDKQLMKNTVLTVKHQDFETQDGIDLADRTSAVINVKF